MAAPEPVPTDFDALRNRALATLQRLAGATWTDHNAHDPGITLLEQLCYALTDLGYRTAYPVADLLAGRFGGDAAVGPDGALRDGVFGPAQVLPSGPVTLDDLRRVLVDLPGVKNAWIEAVDEPLARHDAAQRLLQAVPRPGAPEALATASPNVTDLRPRGLYRVRLEKSGLGEDVDGSLLVRLAAQRLQQWRGLGEDIADIGVLDRAPVALDASIELSKGADGAEALAAVYQAVACYMSPDLPFRSLRELLERGLHVDQIFEGPLLSRGFLDPAEWAAARRRSTLRVSDLIQVLMAVPGVQAVKSLGFLRDGEVSADWLLPIAADRSASFDLPGSRLRLEQAGLRIDHGAMRDSARRLFEARARQDALAPLQDTVAEALDPAPGRVRQVGRYLSVQHHLPSVYGVGPAGLSPQESPERHAQARQLKAYLLLFDQLLANQFAQLAQAPRLLSFDDAGTEVRFAQPVEDEGGALQLDSVRHHRPDKPPGWLDAITRDPWGDDPDGERALARRHRLIDHLLARLGETWGEQRPVPADPDDAPLGSAGPGDAAVLSPRLRALQAKQAYLRDYPRLSVRRGVGDDALQGADAEPSGLAQRLSQRLGWTHGGAALPLVEHILLRPLPGDAWQDGALMRDVAQHDPFSLQLSLVLPAQDSRLADPDLRLRVEQTVRDEAPAHLALRLVWLDAAAMADGLAALARWRALRQQAMRQRFGLDAAVQATDAPDHQIALRSARNRVIDALGLGDTYPLTDLTVGDGGLGGPIKVAHGRSARIVIDGAESGVRYALRGPDGRPLQDAHGNELPVVAADGADAPLVLDSPAVHDDITYRILATKLRSAGGLAPQPPVLLTQGATVKVGLDTRLAVSLPDLPLLDATLANAQPSDARLCEHGARVRVQVHLSQEGVLYALVIADAVLASSVVGNLDTIELLTPPLAEDTDIAVLATKRFSGGADGLPEQQPLDTRLRVAVRPDLSARLQALPAAVVDPLQPDAVLRLSTSQTGVSYQLWTRRVRDAEWLREPADLADAGLLRTGADGPVVRPIELQPDGTLPPGFVPTGTDPLPGQGGPLDLPLSALAADSLCRVRAIKQHVTGETVIATEGWLALQALVMVRPDADPPLHLSLVQPAGDVPPLLRLSGGQPGVYYHLGPADEGPAWAAPAYQHQRDDRDASFNKGLGQLAIGIDLAVATDPGLAEGEPPPRTETLARERLAPAAPLLDLPPLAVGASLVLEGVKAQTGVGRRMLRKAQLPTLPVLPAWHLEPEYPAPGQSARVWVAASLGAERYHLRVQGRALADPVPGQDGPLGLDTGPLAADTRLVLHIDEDTPADRYPVDREGVIDLRLRPRDDLAVSALRPAVAAGEATGIRVADTQTGVLYQLQSGERAIGDACPGTGGEITLASGPIDEAIRFTVLARRIDRPDATVTLVAAVAVALLPVPPPPEPDPAPAAPAALEPLEPLEPPPGPAPASGDVPPAGPAG